MFNIYLLENTGLVFNKVINTTWFFDTKYKY